MDCFPIFYSFVRIWSGATAIYLYRFKKRARRDVTFAFASRALPGPRFLFLDAENHLIADEVQRTGQSIALPSTHAKSRNALSSSMPQP